MAEGFYLLELGDHRQLELQLPVYDALYAWCKNEVGARERLMGLVRTASSGSRLGKEPGFDHADVYRPGRPMYVAHTGADRIDVIDCEAQNYCAHFRIFPASPAS